MLGRIRTKCLNDNVVKYSINDKILLCMIRLCIVSIVLAALIVDARAYVCVFCLPGKYKSVIANNACLDCPTNTYVNYSGADNYNDCMACPANSQALQGSSQITDCKCNPGFYGPLGGPCTPCQTGKYAAVEGQASCTTCPANQDSPLQSDEITDCACVLGYTGPNGGVCEQCALNTYKTTTGNHSCTSCEVNTMTLQTGNSNINACICNPGYTGNGAIVNILTPYSSTACSRFIAMTPTPSFASVATRNNVAIGSTIKPTYNPLGGPNGKGHVSFNTVYDQYLNAGSRTLNIHTNGGLSIVMVVRFRTEGRDPLSNSYSDTLLDMGNGDGSSFTFNNNIIISRYYNTLHVEKYNGNTDTPVELITQDIIVYNAWMTIQFTYRASDRRYTLYVDGVMKFNITDGVYLNDRTVSETFIAKSTGGGNYFHGDMAGVFVVDEYMSIDAITGISDAMKQGVDLTTVCDGGCSRCSVGQYKVDPGPQACTNCSANKYSTATAATSNTTCQNCPENTVSASGSGVLTACKCNLGYTSPSGDGLACDACVQGKYKTATGSQACTDCDFGKYSGAVALTTATCISCGANQMTNDTGKDELVDCRCNAGFTGNDGTHCYQCDAGKYKPTTGDATCTLCPQDRYSTNLAATSGATCLECPSSSQSPQGASAKAACICNMGYTGLGGSLTLPYVPSTAYADLTQSCGVNGNQKCTCVSSEAISAGRLCASAIDDDAFNSIFTGKASDCSAGAYCGFGQTNVQPFIRIDFGQKVSVTSVRIRTTWDGWAPKNFNIFIGDSTFIESNTKCASDVSFPIDGSGTERTTQCTGVGMYIFIQQGLYPGNYLQIYEMWVVGSTVEKNVPCAACVAGTYKPTNGSATCTNCIADTYSTVVAATSNTCVGCPLYMQSAVASGAITNCKCNAGYTGSDGVLCTGCVAGKYKTVVGAVACTNCLVNTFSTAVAKTDASCTTCLSVTTGPSQSLAGSALQTDCKCNMGYSGSNGSTCLACPRGAFKPSVGDATCSLCPTNTYQPALARTANTDCLGCPANSLSLQASDELTDCQCKSGYFGANGSTCSECYAGKFKPLKGPQDCDLCPNGTYSGVFAATSDGVCNACQANSLSWAGSTVLTDCHCNSGFFTENFGKPTVYCRTCGNGTYNTRLNATACSKCAAGLYSTAIGAKTGEVCLKCMSGFSGEGYAQCDACPPYATAQIASSVITDCKCNPGYTGPDGGTCEECATGKFKPYNGSSVCTNCPLHTYLPFTGASLETECLDCYDNSITLQTGSVAVQDCKCSIGYTSTVSGMDGNECEACTQGKYKNTTGHYPCALCPVNTYLDSTGSTLISQCQQCFSNSISNEGSPNVESCTCVGGFERQ